MKGSGIFLLLFLLTQVCRLWSFDTQLLSQFQPVLCNITFGVETTFTVNNSVLHLCGFSKPKEISPTHPVRINVTSHDATATNKVVFVMRESGGILSWELPLIQPNSDVVYDTTSRILCPSDNFTSLSSLMAPSPYFLQPAMLNTDYILSIYSASASNLHVSVVADVEEEFLIGYNTSKSFAVSPTAPRYFEFKWPHIDANETLASVFVEVDSDDCLCMIFSIQHITCPVFDLATNIKSKGQRQTVNLLGGMKVMHEHFPNGFYAVFSVLPDDVECVSSNSKRKSSFKCTYANTTHDINRVKKVTLYTYDTRGDGIYWIAIISVLCFFGLFYIIGFVASLVYFIRMSKGNPQLEVNLPVNRDRAAEVDEPLPFIDENISDSEEEINPVQDNGNLVMFLSDLSRRNPKILRKKALLYLWNVLTVAMFYCLPVLQLAYSYETFFQETGNQDLCYYNFLCANPLWIFNDFNHVFSNVGYVALGLLFMLLSYRRDWMHQYAVAKNNNLDQEYGVPQHFGLFYALGAALCFEGLLSACYHVCPSQHSFQFDTSFMYIIAMLCMLKIYQSRHPDVNASAYATFFMLALVIVIVVANTFSNNKIFWIVFTVTHLALCIWLSGKIYYFNRLQLGFSMFNRAYCIIKDEFIPDPLGYLTPNYPARMMLLVLGNVCNWLVAIMALTVYKDRTSFGTYLLIIFMSNLSLYTIFYIVMKIIHREKLLLSVKLYLIFSVVFWSLSMVLYLHGSSSWSISPANSRTLNHKCLLLQFYDAHDLWHFLSAVSMFISFMALLTLDDDLIHVPRTAIRIF